MFFFITLKPKKEVKPNLYMKVNSESKSRSMMKPELSFFGLLRRGLIGVWQDSKNFQTTVTSYKIDSSCWKNIFLFLLIFFLLLTEPNSVVLLAKLMVGFTHSAQAIWLE